MHITKATKSLMLRTIIILCALTFLYLPIVTLIAYSFNESRMVTVWTNFSLKWYYSLFNNGDIGRAVSLSLILALMSSITSVVIGTLAAFVLVRVRSFRGESLFLLLITAPMVLPEVITGLALLLIFITLGDGFSIFADRGLFALWVSHVTFCSAYTTVVIRSRFRELDISIEEAAMDLGAGPIKVFFKIILPALIPAEVAALLLSFTMSLDDLVITSFIAGPDSTTLPMLIFSSVRRGLSPEINALATIIVLIVSIFTFFAWLSMVKKQKRQRQDADNAATASIQEAEAHLHHKQSQNQGLNPEYMELLKSQVAALQEGRDIADEVTCKWLQMSGQVQDNADTKNQESKQSDHVPHIEETISLAKLAGDLAIDSNAKNIVNESSLAQHKEQMKAKVTKSLGDTAKEATFTIQPSDLENLKVKVVDNVAAIPSDLKNESTGLSKPTHMPKATTTSSIEAAKAKANAKVNTMTSDLSRTPRETTTSSLAKAKAKTSAKARSAAETSAVAVTKANTDLAKSSTEQAKVVDDTQSK